MKTEFLFVFLFVFCFLFYGGEGNQKENGRRFYSVAGYKLDHHKFSLSHINRWATYVVTFGYHSVLWVFFFFT